MSFQGCTVQIDLKSFDYFLTLGDLQSSKLESPVLLGTVKDFHIFFIILSSGHKFRTLILKYVFSFYFHFIYIANNVLNYWKTKGGMQCSH